MISPGKRIISGYATSLLGVLSGVLTNIWLLRELTRVIEVSDLGIYLYLLQVVSYFAILQLGLDFAAAREIAERTGNRDFVSARVVYERLRRFNLILAVVVAFLGLICTLGIKLGLLMPVTIRTESRALASEVAGLISLSQVLLFSSRPSTVALIGAQFQSAVNIVTVGRTIGTTLLAFCLLQLDFYVLSVAVAEVVTHLIAIIVLRALARRKCRSLFQAPSPQIRPPQTWVRYAIVSALGGLAWTLESTSDVIISGTLGGVELVAIYVIWWRIPAMVFDAGTRLAFSAFPVFAHQHGVAGAASNIFSKTARVTSAMCTLAIITVSVLLPPFIDVWVGEKYSVERGSGLALLMGLLVGLRIWGNLLGIYSLSEGRANLTTVLSWMQAGVKIVLAILFVRHFGLHGLVAASCCASLLQGAFLTRHFLRRQVLLTSDVLRLLFLGFLALGGAILLGGNHYMVGWKGVLFGGMGITGLWAVICLVAFSIGRNRFRWVWLIRKRAAQEVQ
jgi:O-antigen/teichoic acid export membrane protein